MMRKAETDMIEYALSEMGTVAAAADILEVSRGFLSQRCKKLEIVLPSQARGDKRGRPRKAPTEAESAAEPVSDLSDGVDFDEVSATAPSSIRGVPDVDPDDLEDPDDFEDSLAPASFTPGNGAAPIPPFSYADDVETAAEDYDPEADV